MQRFMQTGRSPKLTEGIMLLVNHVDVHECNSIKDMGVDYFSSTYRLSKFTLKRDLNSKGKGRLIVTSNLKCIIQG